MHGAAVAEETPTCWPLEQHGVAKVLCILKLCLEHTFLMAQRQHAPHVLDGRHAMIHPSGQAAARTAPHARTAGPPKPPYDSLALNSNCCYIECQNGRLTVLAGNQPWPWRQRWTPSWVCKPQRCAHCAYNNALQAWLGCSTTSRRAGECMQQTPGSSQRHAVQVAQGTRRDAR